MNCLHYQARWIHVISGLVWYLLVDERFERGCSRCIDVHHWTGEKQV